VQHYHPRLANLLCRFRKAQTNRTFLISRTKLWLKYPLTKWSASKRILTIPSLDSTRQGESTLKTLMVSQSSILIPWNTSLETPPLKWPDLSNVVLDQLKKAYFLRLPNLSVTIFLMAMTDLIIATVGKMRHITSTSKVCAARSLADLTQLTKLVRPSTANTPRTSTLSTTTRATTLMQAPLNTVNQVWTIHSRRRHSIMRRSKRKPNRKRKSLMTTKSSWWMSGALRMKLPNGCLKPDLTRKMLPRRRTRTCQLRRNFRGSCR